MTKQSPFRPGQTVLVRELWRDGPWSLRPEIVVRDAPDLLALYMPPGAIWQQPRAPDGGRATVANRVRADWVLKTVSWRDYYRLRLTVPGSDYSVLLFWDITDLKHYTWYINLEEPLRRTAMGFDYLDLFLDLIVEPDLSGWHWKDEDEMEEAVTLGVLSREKTADLRLKGEKALAWLQSGRSPFNGWENWRPDPIWQTPVLPEGWDRI